MILCLEISDEILELPDEIPDNPGEIPDSPGEIPDDPGEISDESDEPISIQSKLILVALTVVTLLIFTLVMAMCTFPWSKHEHHENHKWRVKPQIIETIADRVG